MRCSLCLLSLAGVAAFAGYYRHWSSHHDLPLCLTPQPAAIGPAFQDEFAGRDGRVDAEDDFLNGKLAILSYGLPVAWSADYAALLRRKHEIELRAVAGCMVSQRLVEYVAAYNEVMERHIRTIHGPDVFTLAQRDARFAYETRRSRQQVR